MAPENIFFLSIGAFDQLLGHCENSVDKIIEILSGFVKNKADISTKRFVFEHYLQDQKGVAGDQTLSDTFKAYHKELLKEYFNRDI
ncbi:hypothetical protein [Bdellovibrio bacteriovorus]|uniref:hypothetical protein n=1 Tax=Bdellovibrio bacteriovorus TaxID=959 RepID=UPI003CFEA34B